MDYDEAREFLNRLLDRERAVRPSYPDSLDEYREFLKRMGSPHLGLKSILIAGTKGKGSTAFFLYEILRKLGFKTGLYTSPHLVEVRERIRFNGRCISGRDFGRIVEKIAPHVESVGFRSVFETLTTLAFFYFREREADYSVFEVGLGGRLDATNVVSPCVSVLTDISYDHTHVLGKRLRDITREKLGITRKNVPLLSQAQSPVVRRYVREFFHGEVFFVGIDEKVEIESISMDGVKFIYRGEEFFIPIPGAHQAMNAATAIEVVIRMGLDFDYKSIKSALKKAFWPGRFHIISKKPLIILDGAHNLRSTGVLVDTWRAVTEDKPVVLFTAMKRKPVKRMLLELKGIADEFVFTTLPLKRALDIDLLKKKGEEAGLKSKGFGSVNEAWGYVKSLNRPILVTGSLYLAGEVLKEEGLYPCNSIQRIDR